MSEIDIWTEKYRPQRLADVVGQEHIIGRLQAWVKEKSIPHMIFAGPAGTGKTTVALALARELFGPNWRENFQNTNASDERGIDVVRGRIKDFARTKTIAGQFKIIFLDEADALTQEAQQALRRTIENYSDICRFIFSCNYSNRIIEPIQSRTAIFRFKALSEKDVVNYLKKIVACEKLTADDDGLKAIYELSEGDMRKAINLLQIASNGHISRERVYKIACQARPDDVAIMLGYVLDGKFDQARKMLYNLLIDQGLAGEDILKAIHKQLFDLKIAEQAKLELIEKIAEIEFRINQGGLPDIQLLSLLAQFLKYKKEK
jgi:replication factor C small subunit